jgi:hypothetical protein
MIASSVERSYRVRDTRTRYVSGTTSVADGGSARLRAWRPAANQPAKLMEPS